MLQRLEQFKRETVLYPSYLSDIASFDYEHFRSLQRNLIKPELYKQVKNSAEKEFFRHAQVNFEVYPYTSEEQPCISDR